MSKLSSDWRVILLVVSVALSLWFLQPTYTATGWQVNIQKGFDIQGGARAILEPGNGTTPEITTQLINIMQTRLNVYGITDIKIRPASDLAGHNYIIVEAAGLTEEDVRELLARQGKFEARIGNVTVLTGNDIQVETYKSGIRQVQGSFQYQIPMTVTNMDAAQKFADITKTIPEEFSLMGGTRYLNESLELYIDNKLVGDPLKISADLKGKIVTNPVIEGSAKSREEALKEMEQMTAILQTGALPIEITILSVDSVSPTLGAAFLKNTVMAGVLAVLSVLLVVFISYRKPITALAIFLTGLSEIIIILGIASVIKWQIDLAAIAGIIMTVGTGVDQQIIMTDEVLSGRNKREDYSLSHKLKDAAFIIFTAFGTVAAVMIPLVFIGLGSVKGFAITTLLGVTSGILITRPAYLRIIQYLAEENKI